MNPTSITDSDDSSDDSQTTNIDANTTKYANNCKVERMDDDDADGGDERPIRSSAWVTATDAQDEAQDSDQAESNTTDTERLPDILNVSCGDLKAKFHVAKLGQGSCGACIRYKDEWLTPNQLQMLAGKETAKDWKRSIRFRGQSMKWWVGRGHIRPHHSTCRCTNCGVKQPVVGSKRKKAAKGKTVTTPTSDIIYCDKSSTPLLGLKKADAAANLRVWSGATTSKAEGAEESKFSNPELTSSNRKRRYHVRLSEDKQQTGLEQDASTSSQVLISPPAEHCKMDQSFWKNLKLRNLSDDVETQKTSPTTEEQRTAHDNEVEMNGTPWTASSKPNISLLLQEQHLPVDPEMWSVDQVCVFVKKLGFGGYSCFFKENEVDGEALMLMREEHLLNVFKLKLGPALKLYKLIRKLQTL